MAWTTRWLQFLFPPPVWHGTLAAPAVPASDNTRESETSDCYPEPDSLRIAVLGEPPAAPSVDDQFCQSSLGSMPAVAADGGRVGEFIVRAASIAGRSHTRRGWTREDDYAVSSTSTGVVIVAVADGLGDPRVRFASVGAYAAVRESVKLLRSRLEDSCQSDLERVVEDISALMVAAAERVVGGAVAQRELSTTLTLCWIFPDGRYQGLLVGDGNVAELVGSSWLQLFEDVAAIVNDPGSTIPSPRPRVTNFGGSLADSCALLIGTDGFMIPLASPEVNRYLAKRWASPPSVPAFLADVSFERRGEADDRTAVCVWRRPQRESDREV